MICPHCKRPFFSNGRSAKHVELYHTIRGAAAGTVFRTREFTAGRADMRSILNAINYLRVEGSLERIGYGIYQRTNRANMHGPQQIAALPQPTEG